MRAPTIDSNKETETRRNAYSIENDVHEFNASADKQHALKEFEQYPISEAKGAHFQQGLPSEKWESTLLDETNGQQQEQDSEEDQVNYFINVFLGRAFKLAARCSAEN